MSHLSGFALLDIERDISHGLHIERHAWNLLHEVTLYREERMIDLNRRIHEPNPKPEVAS